MATDNAFAPTAEGFHTAAVAATSQDVPHSELMKIYDKWADTYEEVSQIKTQFHMKERNE